MAADTTSPWDRPDLVVDRRGNDDFPLVWRCHPDDLDFVRGQTIKLLCATVAGFDADRGAAFDRDSTLPGQFQLIADAATARGTIEMDFAARGRTRSLRVRTFAAFVRLARPGSDFLTAALEFGRAKYGKKIF